MSVDFVRASSSTITSSSIPIASWGIILEAWVQADALGSTGGIFYGGILGIFNTASDLKAMIRIKEDRTGLPIQYYAEMVVKAVSATGTATSAAITNPGNWHHILGYWALDNAVGVVLDGTLTTGSSPAGLFSGITEYAMGYDGGIAGDYFDGRIAEAAVWGHNITSGLGQKPALVAHVGCHPIHRMPFTDGSGKLRSWLPLHKTGTNQDVIRPNVTYTETNVTSYADHPPVFDPRRSINYPRAALAAPAVTQRMGIPMTPHLIVG